MKHSGQPTKGAETRLRVLDSAARRFRTDGFAGASVSKIMREAGLTHGGFYAHFADKDELFAESVRHAADTAGDWVEAQLEGLDGVAWIHAWVDLYLSDRHCDSLGAGCPMPSLSPEVQRAGDRAAESFNRALARRLARVRPHIPCDPEEADRRLVAAYAQMVGAVMLSRVLSDTHAVSAMRGDIAQSVKSLLVHGRASSAPERPGADT